MTTTTPYERHPMQDWVPETRTLLIGGRATEPQGETWDVVNPATEEVIATVQAAPRPTQVDEAVAAARGAFPAWAALSGEERARHIHRFADVLEAAADRLLPSIVNEVGTPVSLAEYLQVKMAVQDHLRWAAEAAKVDRTIHLGGFDKPHPTESDVVHEPVGVVAAITGYNYPLNLAIFKFGAALAAGCTVVLLPSPRTPLTTLLLGDLIQEAGLPPGVMNVIVGGVDVGQAAVLAPRRRPGLVHRLRRRRRADHGPGGAQPHRRHPGARRQVAQHGHAGRRRAQDRRRDAPAVVAQRRPGLRGARPAPRARGQVRGVPRRRCVGLRPDGRRRPLGPGDQRRPDDPARPPRAGARLHRRVGVDRRQEAARGDQAAAREGLLRQPGAAGQPAARRPRRAGGDLRPGRGDPAVQGHRPRHPAGQRHGLRPGRQRVVQRPGGGPPHRPADPRRHGVDQRRRRDASRRAVRRLRPLGRRAASSASGA